MARKLMSPSDLLSEAWNVFTLRWKTLVLINLVPVALGMIVALVVVVLAVTTGIFSALQFGNGDKLGEIVLVLLPIFLLFYIVIILLSLWAQIASLIAISQHTKELSVSKCFELAKSKIFPYFGTAFIVGLIIGVGYMLFFVPGIILGIWFSFAGFVVINENKTGLDAALTSRGYLRGRFVDIFGRFALIGGIYLGLWLLFAGLQAVLGESKETKLLSLLIALISNVVFFIMNIVAIIYAYLLYEDVKNVHGGQVKIENSTKQKYILFSVIGFIVSLVLIVVFIGSAIAMMGAIQQNMVSPAGNQNEQMMELLERGQSPYGNTSQYEQMMYQGTETPDASPAEVLY